MHLGLNEIMAGQTFWTGVTKYTHDFMIPSWNVLRAFMNEESDKWKNMSFSKNITDYNELYNFVLHLLTKGVSKSFMAIHEYSCRKMQEGLSVWYNTVFCTEDGVDILSYLDRETRLLNVVVHDYPKAIEEIASEYGFHFEEMGYLKTDETERFELYQVLPLAKEVHVQQSRKPVVIIPPYVLGANILAFLPRENKSYVHCFANLGIPTYVRVPKNIATHEAVQTMTGEDDVRDTQFFCQQVKERHGKPVTLNGYCQGGFLALLACLSGALDGLIDAFITCVSPMDGTRGESLHRYVQSIPKRFRNINYALKRYPSGNYVVDGEIMAWVYKLRSLERDSPLIAFFYDLQLFERQKGVKIKISDTAAAINHWMIYDRQDLPLEITKLSLSSYLHPVAQDGTLPFRLFDRELNFKHIQEQGIRWQICVGEKDDLVDKESALSPLDYVDAEVAVFPKGHAAIATSWAIPLPGSEYALLSQRFSSDTTTYRGPVRFHLDLDSELEGISLENSI
jgi:hypothetical protein